MNRSSLLQIFHLVLNNPRGMMRKELISYLPLHLLQSRDYITAQFFVIFEPRPPLYLGVTAKKHAGDNHPPLSPTWVVWKYCSRSRLKFSRAFAPLEPSKGFGWGSRIVLNFSLIHLSLKFLRIPCSRPQVLP